MDMVPIVDRCLKMKKTTKELKLNEKKIQLSKLNMEFNMCAHYE